MPSLAERQRLQELTHFERAAKADGYHMIAGIDEAGRGPLAGPVVAAACIIPENVFIPGVNDSKQLKVSERVRLYEEITKNPRIIYGVGIIHSDEIDRINILQATIRAMFQAIEKLSTPPDLLLVDGMSLPHTVPSKKIIKGDAKSQSIAAASIIAKQTRDAIMIEYDREYPTYGFAQHKGYGTAQHVDALEKYGPCPLHRKSFEPIKSMLGQYILRGE